MVITNILLKTSDSGNPDGDLVYVIGTLLGTVIYVNDYAYEFVTGTFSGTFSVSDGRTSVVDNGQIKDIFYYLLSRSPSYPFIDVATLHAKLV